MLENNERLKTTRQLAYRLGVSESTVKNWKQKGLPHLQVGRILRFELAEVEPWLRQQSLLKSNEGASTSPARRRRRGAHQPRG
jgi:excisionase family DNA binding protein